MNYSTIQRQTILETVKSLRTHPTAKEVFVKVKKQLPGLSFATVYRNLNHLVKLEQLKEIKFGDDAVRYDSFLREHQHFICNTCQAIYDLELSKLLNIEQEVKKIPCHEVKYYNLELYGVCHKCKVATSDVVHSMPEQPDLVLLTHLRGGSGVSRSTALTSSARPPQAHATQ